MKRIAMTALLRNDPELIRQYEQYHANAWPEVIEGNRRIGVNRAFIYRYGAQLFLFMEVVDDFDLERDLPKYMEHPRARQWDELMRTFQQNLPGEPEDSTWMPMNEVFVMENQ